MKKILLILFGMIVSLNAEIYKMSIPLDIDGFGNHKIIYQNQPHTITKVKVVGDFSHSGGRYFFAVGSKTIPLTSAGIHETVVFEKNAAELTEAKMRNSGFLAQIEFCTDNDTCFVKASHPRGEYINIDDTNFNTFANIQNMKSSVGVTKK
jgi:hypothetical protein